MLYNSLLQPHWKQHKQSGAASHVIHSIRQHCFWCERTLKLGRNIRKVLQAKKVKEKNLPVTLGKLSNKVRLLVFWVEQNHRPHQLIALIEVDSCSLPKNKGRGKQSRRKYFRRVIPGFIKERDERVKMPVYSCNSQLNRIGMSEGKKSLQLQFVMFKQRF